MDYRAVFSSIPLPATLIDAAGLIVDVNQAFLDWARDLGRDLRREDRIGRPVTDFSGMHVPQQVFASFIERLLNEHQPQHLQWEGQLEDGHLVWGEVCGQVILDEGGRLKGAIILREDVTAEVLRERRQQLSQRLRDEIWRMQGADDMERVMVAVQAGLHNLGLPIDDCGVNLVDGSSDPPNVQFHSMTAEGTWRPTGYGDGSDIVLQLWREGQIAYRRDLMQEDEFTEASQIEGLFHRRVRSVIDVPFAYGTLAVNSSRPHAFNDMDIEILQEMAQVLSEAFDRLADIDALRQSEQRYRATVSQIADAVVLIDRETQ